MSFSGQTYVESPTYYQPLREPTLNTSWVAHSSPPSLTPLSLFLAGGISNCPNWQATVRDRLQKSCPELVLFNPRRETYDTTSSDRDFVLAEQIKWEHVHLHLATAILFWFPSESVCPISLYELGTWSIMGPRQQTRVFLGTHREYTRRRDIQLQLELANGSIHVHDDMDKSCRQVEDWYHNVMAERRRDVEAQQKGSTRFSFGFGILLNAITRMTQMVKNNTVGQAIK